MYGIVFVVVKIVFFFIDFFYYVFDIVVFGDVMVMVVVGVDYFVINFEVFVDVNGVCFLFVV